MKPNRTFAIASMIALTSCASFKSTPPVTRMVELDGLSIRAVTANLDARAPGQAVVVFESGGGAPLETWDPVFSEVARFAPVVAYDRAGTGRSEWNELPPTPERVTARLHRLLQQLGVAPPYLLVGHSWGGALVRYFAGNYPADVAAILYLDPTDITQSPADELAVFQWIGAGAAERDAFYRLMEQSMTAAPAPLKAESVVAMSLFRSEPTERDLPPAPNVPTSVILAGQVNAPPGGLLPFDTEAHAQATLRDRVQRLRTWARDADGGRFVVADQAGHSIHTDDPDLVVDEIRRLASLRR
jgi:pimeloyl-ACP methyl ester carboxylesterase